MKLTFTTNEKVQDTMVFDSLFEKELQFDIEYKKELLSVSTKVWLRVDGGLAGEVYGIKVKNLPEFIPDTKKYQDRIYLYSLAILPKYRGLGLSKILLSYFFGISKCKKFIWHATSKSMIALSSSFGASFGKTRINWCGSKRKAVFCLYETDK